MNNIRYYIDQLRMRSLREVIGRSIIIFGQRIVYYITKTRIMVFGTGLTNRGLVFKDIDSSFSIDSAESLKEYFSYRSSPAFYSVKDISHAAQLFEKLLPHYRDSIVTEADIVCEHVFDLLGAGETSLCKSINWHRDFKTGFDWNSRKYYRDIEIPYGQAEIRVPWELSRFCHAVTLGQAYMLTKDEKYAKEFVSQVEDWLENNKPHFGVNWACTMDVAIRACNWVMAYPFLKDSPEISDEFLLAFLKSLYQHGKHIRANLEYSDAVTSNHYLSNIAGLSYLGVLFPEFRDAEEWRTFGIQELKKEMEKQVYPDGSDFEASTCYHRLVLELFFYSTMIVVINDVDFDGQNYCQVTEKVFGAEYTERLYKMFDAVLYLLKPNGMMPQIGDNDSGRFHVFMQRNILDMRYLLTFGALFFNEPKFRVKEFGFSEEALCSFGKEGYENWQSLPEHTLRDIQSKTFPDAGWYVMRNERDYLIVSCGPNGQNGNGGHAHNDKLSFELCLDSQNTIVDPGTYVYTPEPEMRNLFRSTEYHNTVCIEGHEQNRIPEGNSGLFRLHDDAKAEVLEWETTLEYDRFVGMHYGYKSAGVIHRREIRFDRDKRTFTVHDLLEGEKSQTGMALFHFSPEIKINAEEKSALKAGNALITFQGSRGIELSEYYYSKEYGVKEKSKVLKVSFESELQTVIKKISE
jgi:hypothetical protein